AVILELITFIEDWAAATDITYAFLAAEVPNFEYQNIHAWFFRGFLEIVKVICIAPLLLYILVESLVKYIWSVVVGLFLWILAAANFQRKTIERRDKESKGLEFSQENPDL